LAEHTEDRRAHRRFPTQVELQGTPETGGVVARMVASNLSLGGLYCVSSADFPEMTRLAVRLMLPAKGNGDMAPLDVEAVVVRREKLNSASGQPRYELGLFFTRVEDGEKEQLNRFLSTMP